MRSVIEIDRERERIIRDFYLGEENREKVEKILEGSLKAFRKWREGARYLVEGRSRGDGWREIVDERGKVWKLEREGYGAFPREGKVKHIEESYKGGLTFGVCWLVENASIYFPPRSIKEKWKAEKDEEFFEGKCLWGLDDDFPELVGTRLEYITPPFVNKEGYLEIEALLYPLNENWEFPYKLPSEEDITFSFPIAWESFNLVRTVAEEIPFLRLQSLLAYGMISWTEFEDFCVHMTYASSLLSPYTSYIPDDEWRKVIANVVVPLGDALKEGKEKVVLEVEDVNELGLFDRREWEKYPKVPVRLTVYDARKKFPYPLLFESYTVSSECLPEVEEVEMVFRQSLLYLEWSLEDLKREGVDKEWNSVYVGEKTLHDLIKSGIALSLWKRFVGA